MNARPFPETSRFDEAILTELRKQGGATTNAILERGVAQQLRLSTEALEQLHAPERGSRTEFSYRLAWAKTRLKAKGLIERTGTKSWRLVGD